MNDAEIIELTRHLVKHHDTERLSRLDPLKQSLEPWDFRSALREVSVKSKTKQGNIEPLNSLAANSQTNFLPLVLDTFSQAMKVDNYFSSEGDEAPPWAHWQRNQMDARQSGIHRAALLYGVSYAVVLPTPGGVQIRGASPRKMYTEYGNPLAWSATDTAVSDEWPVHAIERNGRLLRVYTKDHVHFVEMDEIPGAHGSLSEDFLRPENYRVTHTAEHGFMHCPIVRFRDRMLLDGEEQRGIIEPLLSIQKRIDETTFEMLVGQYFGAFKQRYIMGWLPKNESERMAQNASDTWYFSDSSVKAGQFDAIDLGQYISSKSSAVRDLAAIAQIPAQTLGVDGISNVSAEGLDSLATAKARKSAEIQTSLGESWEQVLRTCAFMTDDMDSANDFGSEVKWRDMEARNFAAIVDGLGKISTMLNVPPEILWEDIPGWTRQKVDRATKLAPLAFDNSVI